MGDGHKISGRDCCINTNMDMRTYAPHHSVYYMCVCGCVPVSSCNPQIMRCCSRYKMSACAPYRRLFLHMSRCQTVLSPSLFHSQLLLHNSRFPHLTHFFFTQSFYFLECLTRLSACPTNRASRVHYAYAVCGDRYAVQFRKYN